MAAFSASRLVCSAMSFTSRVIRVNGFGVMNEVVDRVGHLFHGALDDIHFAEQHIQVAAAFRCAGQAFLGLVLDVLGALGNRRNARYQLLDRCGSHLGFLVLLMRTLGDAIGAVGERR